MTNAILNAGLTERQTFAVAAFSGFELTHAEVAQAMGIGRRTATELIDTAAEKIAEVFRKWEYGAATAEFDEDAEVAA
ncbi:hypothetical protein D3C74_426940 [compost metagenome]